jgi:hypothetical protein
MKKIQIPYRTMLEKLADEELPENGKEIEKKWLGVFEEEDFRKIITYKRDMADLEINEALTENSREKILMEIDNPALNEPAKIKLIAGSFENFYYLRTYMGMIMNKRFYRRNLETPSEIINFIKYANKVLGKEIVNKLFFNNLSGRNKK